MARVNRGRCTADPGERDEIVLFLIGMRINRLWQFWRWIPVFVAMPRMLIELQRDPSLGLVGRPRNFASGRTLMVLQYWNSFEQLERYARDAEHLHLPAWRSFNRRIRDNGSVGIFHETYRVPVSAIETIYGNMPPFGLGTVGTPVKPEARRQTAATRLGVRADDEAPVEPY